MRDNSFLGKTSFKKFNEKKSLKKILAKVDKKIFSKEKPFQIRLEYSIN